MRKKNNVQQSALLKHINTQIAAGNIRREREATQSSTATATTATVSASTSTAKKTRFSSKGGSRR